MAEPPYDLFLPQGSAVPVVLSSPHSGTEIPDGIRAGMHDAPAKTVPDTDWYVDQLYDFAPALGITLIRARFSRYVIDLNRNPSGGKLYGDGRQETELVPTRTFAGEPIYDGPPPDDREIARRYERYYKPYHEKLAQLLEDLRSRFETVLLFDAHSIPRRVTTIRDEPFPDLILGDQGRRTAAPELIDTALARLGEGGYDLAHNEPFSGGYITRSFGQPKTGIHALQLEMSQDVYLDPTTRSLDERKLATLRPVLEGTLTALADAIARSHLS